MEFDIKLPVFENNAIQIEDSCNKAIAKAENQLDGFVKLDARDLSFDNSIKALDRIFGEFSDMFSRIYLLMNVSMSKEIRDKCMEMVQKIQKWSIETEYRQDIYELIKKYIDTNPRLEGASKRLFDDTVKGYSRRGLHLPKNKQKEIKDIKNQLAVLGIQFEQNIRESDAKIKLSKSDLSGLSSELLDTLKKDEEDNYIIDLRIRADIDKIMKNVLNENIRKKVYTERLKIAKATNIPILKEVIKKRSQLGKLLGYKTWADYKTEINMAKTGARVNDFIADLIIKLKPKFKKELEILQGLKIKETGDNRAVINAWDIAYYHTKLIKEKYDIDMNELRPYFSYDKVLKGMFNIFEKIFDIKVEIIDPEDKWADDVSLCVVSDRSNQEYLGSLYLDMFPRDGKFNHFAQFGIISPGADVRPVAALVCNFDKPGKDSPSLLTYEQVDTLFHEAGHAMHTILTRVRYFSQAGTNVPSDFVEVPSQVLEYWVKDKKVLDTFACDYRDFNKKIPVSFLEKLKEIELSSIATHYTAQMAYGLIDINLHSKDFGSFDSFDILKYTNNLLSSIYMPVPADTAFVAGFGHLMGYDAGYYGYAWADVISADIASRFKESKDGFLDTELGKKLRKEIYEQGDLREVTISVEKFLGRKISNKSFLKKIGCVDG